MVAIKKPIEAEVGSYDYTELIFYVNGKKIVDGDIDPRTTLAVYLRDKLKLFGTKIGCNEGGCGACVVMISDMDPVTENIRHYSANSCLTPVCAVFGKAVTTVEGLGSTVQKKLHPIQERLSVAHGSQCGFCTPGFVMAMYALLRTNPTPSEKDVDEALQGNLCRCTGYRPILEAFYSFTKNGLAKAPAKTDQSNGFCAMGENCCKNQKAGPDRKEKLKLSTFDQCSAYDPTQELIFPPELKLVGYHKKSFALTFGGVTWFQPTSLAELLRLKREHPHARLISGNSELAVELKFRFIELPLAINPKQVAELREHRVEEDGVYMGLGLSLTEMKDILTEYIDEYDVKKTAVFRSICAMLHYFAGKHVRNMASVAGNIATASPISDLNPIWMASQAKLHLVSEERGTRVVTIDEKFFVAYRRTVIQPDEVIIAITIPFSGPTQHFRAYKQAQRREDDIAIVTSAFSADVDPETKTVRHLRFAFGGMAPTTKLSTKAVEGIDGRKWNQELLDDLIVKIQEEFSLPPGVPGGMSRYRQALTMSFFFKYFTFVAHQLQIPGFEHFGIDESIGEPQLEHFQSTQIYEDVPKDQPNHDAVGRPVIHQSGEKHVTGEAVYSFDVDVANMLHAALVTSPKAKGRIEYVDITDALELPGVVGYADHTDVPGSLLISHGQVPVFAKDEVSYHCQPIGVIVATDHETARRAANLVKVSIIAEEAIVTIEQAVAVKSFHWPAGHRIHSSLVNGDKVVETDWSKYERIVEGEVKMGGQEHFYFETINCTAIPHENQEMEVIASTQGVSDCQIDVATALGFPMHKVVARVRRLGGGFGGKESCVGLFASITAVAANKLRKPVKFVLERFDDMAISGTRHPFSFQYKAALDKNDKLAGMEVHLFSNGGFAMELSKGVMERAITHIDNVYNIENSNFYGRICKTNLASNTAFRGFGGPQGMFATETIMNHIATQFNLDPNDFRKLNMYHEGDCTPFGMHLNQCNIRRCWDECLQLSDFAKRKREIDALNKTSRYRKRGIYAVPTKFGIGFGFKQLNQAGALIHIYTDGTVLISYAGCEMGQGLHTKIIQIASRCLGVPIELIHVHETTTDKVPNQSPTAASVGSDLNGLAVQDACVKLSERLKPYKEKNPDGQWKDWVMACYVDRVSLSATGFGIIHHEPVDYNNGRGAELYGYCVYGVAVTEVEVDCLSGDHHVIRSDIVMDIGDSLNPAVDIGQIEGAFIQGYGLYTMEEIKIRPDGTRLTRGPGNYKIPSADDVPRHFNVKLLKGSSNNRGIFSSKAVGEPPLFLGSTALFAIKEAIKSYREDHELTEYFTLDSPATAERIRMLCEDKITAKIPELPEKHSFSPWTADI